MAPTEILLKSASLNVTLLQLPPEAGLAANLYVRVVLAGVVVVDWRLLKATVEPALKVDDSNVPAVVYVPPEPPGPPWTT
jgi:hypothetical protein